MRQLRFFQMKARDHFHGQAHWELEIQFGIDSEIDESVRAVDATIGKFLHYR